MVSYRYGISIVADGCGNRSRPRPCGTKPINELDLRFRSRELTYTADRKLAFALTALLAVASVLTGSATAAQQPPAEVLQPQALNYTGLYQLRQLDPNLAGSGIRLAVISRSITYTDGRPQNDYRPAVGHNCFAGAQFAFHDHNFTTPGISPHSTAICSVLLGRDDNAFNDQLGSFRYLGAAPGASADVYEFWHFVINNLFTGSAPDADVIVAGIGEAFDDWWTRAIDSLAEQYGLTVVAGIGNGRDVSDPVLYPGAGANVIGVGVIDSVNAADLAVKLSRFSLALPEHSSAGPTPDGRCKPDIVAPGNCIVADYNDPNGYQPTGNWSSFATPIVAGTAALLLQKANQDPNLRLAASPKGGNCLIKAVLLNSASKLPFWHKGLLTKDDDHEVPLDFAQGAGMLNAADAYRQLIAGRNRPGDCPPAGWDLNQLQKNEKPDAVYRITINKPAGKMIKATLCWNKHYAAAFPYNALPETDADLRLECWAVDTNDPNKDYLLDYSDSRADNTEHLYTPTDPNYTDYEIVASLSDPNDTARPDAALTYALAWNPAPTPDKENILWYDLNADGTVDTKDLDIMLRNILTGIEKTDERLLGDINGDGTIDAADMKLLLDRLGTTADWFKPPADANNL